MSYTSKSTIPVYFLDTLTEQSFKGMNGYCVVFVSAFLCPPVCLLLRCSCSQGDGSRFAYAVSVLSNPRSILTEDHMGSSNLGHSFNLVLLFYGMITWEAAHIYIWLPKCWLQHISWKGKKKKNYIYLWLSCVVLQAGLLWLCILDYGQKKWYPGFEKCWYCTVVLKKKKQIKCSVLVCVNFFWAKKINSEQKMDGSFLFLLTCNQLYILINPKLAEPNISVTSCAKFTSNSFTVN